MNKMLFSIAMSLLMTSLVGCSSVPQKTQGDLSTQTGSITGQKGSLEILNRIPKKIGDFTFQGVKEYPEPLGYASRYIYKGDKKIYADIFSYPLPKEASSYSHKNRVKGMTSVALREIEFLEEIGTYSKAEILKQTTFEQGGKVAERVDTRLVLPRVPFDLYSLLFLTEKNGDLLKIRLTMPLNQKRKDSQDWQIFANKAFSVL